MGLAPVARVTLVSSIADQLLAFIIDNQLKPGDMLPSMQELSEKFQVGRSTIREALKSLTAVGVVDMRAGYGTYVKQLEMNDLIRSDLVSLVIDPGLTERLLESREIIEPDIAALAAERATAEDLANIRDLLEQCEFAIQSGRPVYKLSSQFHRAITVAAHNEILLMFMDSILNLLVERGILLEKKYGFQAWELSSHQSIYDAIASRDPVHARQVMAEHV